MRTSGPTNGQSSKSSVEQSGHNGTIVHHRIRHHLSKFGRVVCALWPIKPALHLSQEIGCSERGAQYLIDGDRKVTAKAIHVVDGEMLEEGP